jgi:hypothetical protein
MLRKCELSSAVVGSVAKAVEAEKVAKKVGTTVARAGGLRPPWDDWDVAELGWGRGRRVHVGEGG